MPETYALVATLKKINLDRSLILTSAEVVLCIKKD